MCDNKYFDIESFSLDIYKHGDGKISRIVDGAVIGVENLTARIIDTSRNGIQMMI